MVETLAHLFMCPYSYHLFTVHGMAKSKPKNSKLAKRMKKASDAGIYKHELAAMIVSKLCNQIHAPSVGKELPLGTPTDVVTAISFVRKLLPASPVVNIERNISWLGVVMRPDLWFFDGDCLHIVDYKFGKKPKPVYPNQQLRLYACAICDMIAPANISCHIIAPNTDACIQTHTNSYFNLLTYKRKMEELYVNVMNGYDEPFPSAENCRKCKYRRGCQYRFKAKKK